MSRPPVWPERGSACALPRKLSQLESDLMKKFHSMYCAEKLPNHECQGRVSVDRNGVTLNCPRCGDERKVHG